MNLVPASLDQYRIINAERILTPALLLYPERLDANIRTTLEMAGGDANRWRPHVKTAKLPFTMRRMIEFGIEHFKCSTTLELLTLCQLGARDVLLAFPVVGANAERVLHVAKAYPRTSISALAEDEPQVAFWRGAHIGIFLDLNPGMDRTGISADQADRIVRLAKLAGESFRGLHYYDGQYGHASAEERDRGARQGYRQVLDLTDRLRREGIEVGEIITSGTPVAPVALAFEPFRQAGFIHRVSPGTVVYNDTTSLHQLSEYPYEPAVLVLSTVVSHPTGEVATCDAGHKAVSVDSGVPSCTVLGWPNLIAQKPSEEHLPLRVQDGSRLPAIGESLYLLPRHVCPTVNNFDDALVVSDGRIQTVEPVTARGHETPLALSAAS